MATLVEVTALMYARPARGVDYDTISFALQGFIAVLLTLELWNSRRTSCAEDSEAPDTTYVHDFALSLESQSWSASAVTYDPVLKANKVICTATGTSEESDGEHATAVAAKRPVHNPTRDV